MLDIIDYMQYPCTWTLIRTVIRYEVRARTRMYVTTLTDENRE